MSYHWLFFFNLDLWFDTNLGWIYPLNIKINKKKKIRLILIYFKWSLQISYTSSQKIIIPYLLFHYQFLRTEKVNTYPDAHFIKNFTLFFIFILHLNMTSSSIHGFSWSFFSVQQKKVAQGPIPLPTLGYWKHNSFLSLHVAFVREEVFICFHSPEKTPTTHLPQAICPYHSQPRSFSRPNVSVFDSKKVWGTRGTRQKLKHLHLLRKHRQNRMTENTD